MYAGWNFGEALFQTGMSIQRGLMKSIKDRVLNVTYRSAWDLSPDTLDEHLEAIERAKIAVLTGYAGSIHVLALRAKEVGFNFRCRAAITWASNLLSTMRDDIREGLGCDTFDSYGVGEGMQIASQSLESGSRMHQFCLHVAAEIVDEHGATVPDGERGEIVLTRLNVGAMPLIRYRIEDIGRAAANQEPAGSINLPLWSGVDGRTRELIRTPSGKQLIVEFFFGAFMAVSTISTFQVIQTAPDVLHVKIVPTSDFVNDDWDVIKKEIEMKGDPALKIEFEKVDDIPLEKTGKRRYVVSYEEYNKY
jgi:phenylacetate-CoA ligase